MSMDFTIVGGPDSPRARRILESIARLVAEAEQLACPPSTMATESQRASLSFSSAPKGSAAACRISGRIEGRLQREKDNIARMVRACAMSSDSTERDLDRTCAQLARDFDAPVIPAPNPTRAQGRRFYSRLSSESVNGKAQVDAGGVPLDSIESLD